MSDDFSSGIGGGSSLSFQEKVDEALQGISVKWNDFLDALDEKGIHLRSVNDFFEEKGIPALPAMLFILLAIAGLGFFAFTALNAPAVHDYSFKVVDLDGRPVPGASVTVTYLVDGAATNKDLQTGENGLVKFIGIPSEEVSVNIVANDFEELQTTSKVEQGNAELVTVKLNQLIETDVTALITINGPVSANVEIIDAQGTSITSGIANPTIALSMPPNAVYKVKATADGYRDEEKDLSVQTSNVPAFPIEMFKNGEEKTAPVSIRVFEDSQSLDPIPVVNATITIRNADTDNVIKQLTTADFGDTEQTRIAIGTKFTITAKHDNYLPKTTPIYTAAQTQEIYALRLLKRTEENSKNIVVIITDENGDNLQTPYVNLYCNGALTDTQTPRNGVAAFDVPIGTTCTVTASQNGFLAIGKTLTSKDEQTIILEKATPQNSGQLIVTVIDENNNPVPAATVNLKEQNNAPLGVAAIETDLEGKSTFDYIPLRAITITASTGPRQGTQTITMKNGTNKATITLQAAKAIIDFTIKDHFTQKLISTAQISLQDATGKNQTCATIAGTCSISIPDGDATAKITSKGYEQLETQITAIGGTREEKTIELISNNVANKAKLIYLGLFDTRGKKVQSTSPNTIYKAKYMLRAIETNFTTATAFIQLGDTQTDLENLPAAIIDYAAPGAKTKTAGVDYSTADFFTPNEAEQQQTQGSMVQLDENKKPINSEQKNQTTALENGDLSSTKTTTGTSRVKNTKNYKWVQIDYDKFTGSKQITITLETKLAKNAKIDLLHRTSYETATGETIRQPQDDTAGKTKAPLFAKLEKSASYDITFQGECSDTTCIQLTIDSSTGEQSADKQATVQVPEVFKINFKLLSQENTAQTVSLTSETTTEPPVEIIDAFIGGEKIKTTNPTQITAALKKTNSGEFTLRAKRVANEYLLKFTAQEFEKQISLKVINPKNNLKVTTTPLQLEAFKENKINFKVTDAYDQPVKDAIITINGDAIDSTIDATASVDKNKKPIYTAQITPQNPGTLHYTVTATGYKKYTGDLNTAFKKIIEVTPKTKLSLTTDSQEPQTTTITVTNLLSKTKIKVNAHTLLTNNAKYATLTTNPASFTLDGSATKEVKITTQLREEFLPIAATQNTIKETSDGTITITAKVPTSAIAQTEKIPLTINTIATQQPLTNLIDVSQDAISLEVNPPKTRKATTKIKVTNNAPLPIVINQQSELGNIHVTPASAALLPKQSIEFTVTATPSLQFQSQQCTIGEVTDNGKLSIIATANKIQTTKEINLDVRSTTDERCYTGTVPIPPMAIDMRMQFPPGTQVAKQPAKDGTTTIILPDGQQMVFHDGIQVGPQEAYVPAGQTFEINPNLALQIPPNTPNAPPGLELRIPVNTILSSVIDGSETNLPNNRIRITNQYMEFTFDKINFNAFNPIDYNGKSYRTQFAPSMQQFGYNSQKTYYVPQYMPIQIFHTTLTTGEFKIKFDKNKNAAITNGAQVQETPNGIQIMYPECTRLQLYASDDKKQLTDTLPAARSVEITSASHNDNKVKIPAGSEVKVQTCTNVRDEDDKMYSTVVDTDVTFIASPKVENPVTNNFEITMPECIDLRYETGYSFGIDKAKKIKFPTTITRQAKDEETTTTSANTNNVQVLNVENGDTVNFLPCSGASSTSGVYTVNSRVKNAKFFTVTSKQENEDEILFELTDGMKQPEEVTICLNNYKPETLYPGVLEQRDSKGKKFNTYFKAVLSDNLLRQAITPESLSKATKSEVYAPPLSTTKKKECNNEFKLTAKIPPELLDSNGCVKQDKEVKSQIQFIAKSKNDQELVYNVDTRLLIKQNQDNCQATKTEKAKSSLDGVHVNLENTPSNKDANGNPPILDFKGTGETHALHFTITNNAQTTMQVKINNPPSVTCQAPTTLTAGDAALATCTPISPTTADKIEISTSGQDGETHTIEVQYTIQDQNTLPVQWRNLYTSSPEGKIAPGYLDAVKVNQPTTTQTLQNQNTLNFAEETDETTDATAAKTQTEKTDLTPALRDCQRYFCSLEQAKDAYRDFMSIMTKHANDITSTKENVIQFCADKTAGVKLTKSIVLLLADSKDNYAEITQEKRASSFKESISQTPQITGCGYYQLKATIDPCSGTGLGGKELNQIRDETTIQVEEIRQLATCKPTLANAPLYISGNIDTTNIYIGRKTVGATIGINANSWKDFAHPIDATLGLIALGPYAQSQNPEDADTLKAFLKTAFNSEQIPNLQTHVAQGYNDDAYCLKQGAKQVGALTGGQLGIAAAMTIFSGGTAIPFAAKLAEGAGRALIGCGITTAAQGAATAAGYARADDMTCTSVNFCIREAITAPFTVPGTSTVSTVGSVATTAGKAAISGVKNVKALAASTAVTAVVIGAVNANADDIKEKLPTMPLSAAGSLGRRSATLFAVQPKTDALLETMRAQGGALQKLADSPDGPKIAKEILKAEKAHQGSGVIQMIDEAIPQTTSATAATTVAEITLPADAELLQQARKASSELRLLDQEITTLTNSHAELTKKFDAANSIYEEKLSKAIEANPTRPLPEITAELATERTAAEKAKALVTASEAELNAVKSRLTDLEADLLPELKKTATTAAEQANAAKTAEQTLDAAKAEATAAETAEAKELARRAAVAKKTPTAQQAVNELPHADRIKLQQIATDLRVKGAGKIGAVMANEFKAKLNPAQWEPAEIEDVIGRIGNQQTPAKAQQEIAKILREKLEKLGPAAAGETSEQTAQKLLSLLNPVEQEKYYEFKKVTQTTQTETTHSQEEVLKKAGLKKNAKTGAFEVLDELSENGGRLNAEIKTTSEGLLQSGKGTLAGGAISEVKARPPKPSIKGKIATLVGLVGMQLLLDVDVRPVQFEINMTQPNAFVIYHLKDYSYSISPMKPTSKAICYMSNEGQCLEKYYLTNLCNSDTDACLYVYKKPKRPTTYFFILNNQQIDKETLFKSIMTPGEPLAQFTTEQINVAELTDLTPYIDDAEAIGNKQGVKSYDQDEVEAFKKRQAKTQAIK